MLMAALLKASDLKLSEFGELVRELTLPDGDGQRLRIWAEGASGWALDFWPGVSGLVGWCRAARVREPVSGAVVLEKAYSGRLFAPSGELKWRIIGSLGERCCRTVFLGDVDWLPGRLTPRTELQDLRPRREGYVLWGQQSRHTPGEWVELRIPHRFRYPVQAEGLAPGQERMGVRAVVEVWSDLLGEPHFVRLCDLESYQIAEGE
jgi:hypothetical protein